MGCNSIGRRLAQHAQSKGFHPQHCLYLLLPEIPVRRRVRIQGHPLLGREFEASLGCMRDTVFFFSPFFNGEVTQVKGVLFLQRPLPIPATQLLLSFLFLYSSSSRGFFGPLQVPALPVSRHTDTHTQK